MKKHADENTANDDLDIPPTPPGFFKRATTGRMYGRMMMDCNVVRVAPDLRKAFPNEKSVNIALRELLKIRETLVGLIAPEVKRKKSA